MNKLDKSVQEKLQNRSFAPSNSAWERLAVKLDDEPKNNKKNWFFYAGIAVSILLLISIGFGFFSSKENQFLPKEEIVISPIDTFLMDSKFEEIKLENQIQEAIVEKNDIKIVREIIASNPEKKTSFKEEKSVIINDKKTSTASLKFANNDNVQKNEKQKQSLDFNQDSKVKHKVKVNADDLLYAVTHSQKEVTEYYAKNNIDRKKLLQSIENQLKKSNLKIDANSILAEVEQNINEDTFKSNFLQMIKKKVSDVASAVATRNN